MPFFLPFLAGAGFGLWFGEKLEDLWDGVFGGPEVGGVSLFGALVWGLAGVGAFLAAKRAGVL